ncbi:MAG: hypothetical protein HY290_04465, partial [Planctomycetia bacterium]|nr:hypothetical protein [Planctomycetia bacterium]
LLSSTPTDAYCGLFIVNLTGNCCSTPAYDFTLEIRIFNPNGACPTPPVCAKCIAARQMAPPPPPTISSAPVRYATGELVFLASDFQSNGFGIPWGHTRSFSSRLTTPVNLGNGWNWQIREWTYLILDNLRRGTTSITTAVLMGEAGQTVWFDKTASIFVPRYGELDSLVLDLNSQAFYHTTTDGITTVYSALTGALLSKQDQAGNTLTVVSRAANTFNITEVQRSYTTGGTTTTESFQYTYDDPASAKAQLTTVLLRRKVGSGDWSSVQRANYTYYGYADPNGNPGDLQTVVTQTWAGSAWAETGTTYYRYYARPVTVSGSSSSSLSSLSSASSLSSSSAGALILHAMKFVLLPAMYDQMVADGFNPLSASNAQLSLYADFYYEYDTNGRVVRETVKAGSQTFAFSSVQSAFSDGYNNWSTKTTETLPDGNQNIVYTNYAGLTMLKVFQATATSSSSSSGSSSSGSTANQWCTYFRYNSTGKLILQANPSAVSGFDETKADLVNWQGSTAQYLKNNAGLINTYTYDSASGFKSGDLVQQGTLGLPIIVRQYEYVACCVSLSSSSSSSNPSSSPSPALPCRYLQSKLIEYPDDGTLGSSSSSSGAASGTANGNTRQIITTYSYTFWPGTCAVQQKTTTWPVIPTSQNGSGVAAQMLGYFDVYGNLIWKMDERGYITGMSYDIPTGALVQRIDDVDTTIVSAPAGWTTPADGGLHLITDFDHDTQGRQTQALGPRHEIDIDGVATTIRRATWMVYQDALFQSWVGEGYQQIADHSFYLVNPVAITIARKDGKVTDLIQAVRYAAGTSSSSSFASTSGSIAAAPVTTAGKLTALDSFPQSSFVRWTSTQYTDCCLAASRRVYKVIPPTGVGTNGTNYDETDFGYDVMKRQNRIVTPGGTIARTVFEARGLPIGTWVGTNDTGATAMNPAGSGAPNNLVQVIGNVYDNGLSGSDGNVSQQTAYVDASGTNDRVTSFLYDFRNRRTDTDGEGDLYEKIYYDNLSRLYRNERYNTTLAGNLIMLSTTSFDDRGEVFQSATYAVDPSTGIIGNALIDNTWRDASRHIIKSLPTGSQLFKKFGFDSLGRRTVEYAGVGADANYSAIFLVSNNTILEQTETAFDAAANAIQTTMRKRYHNAAASQFGALGDPSTMPTARVTYVAMYPDALGRVAAAADYGTNGGTALSRPSTIPVSSDTCLVSSMAFNARGEDYLATDPAGTQTLTIRDDADRRTALIENYIAVSSSSSSSSNANTCAASNDKNRTTTFSYTPDGELAAITAVNVATGNQTTTYQYGTTLSDSALASSLLKRYEINPDSVGGSDRKAFAYNRQGTMTTLTDQNGTVHSFDFDKLGRHTADRITTLGAGIDGAVLRITATFEVRGMPEHVTSYDNATVGSGNVVNDVQFAYNSYSQLLADYQSHAGAVDVSLTPKVQYAYADGSANTIRPQTLTYPNGRVLYYEYGTAGEIADSASRVASLIDNDGTTHRADYDYLGTGTIVQVGEPQPEIQYTLVGLQPGNDPDTGNIYRGLDRFGRVKDLIWAPLASSSSSSSSSLSSAAGTNLVRIRHSHDRTGNRLWRKDPVAESFGKAFDELYGYDGLYRLKGMQRGTLNGSQTSITPGTETFAQCWGLDTTGNWRNFREDDTGSGAWNLIQGRSANMVNEITGVMNSVGVFWVTPAYDGNGNMTTIPQPSAPASGFTGTYDAWNRLVKLVDIASGHVMQQNAFDGLRHRTEQKSYTAGVLSESRHYFYSPGWQVLEERTGTSSTAERHFVWGLRYIDDLVVRDRDTTGDGTLDEHLYALQDPNWNVAGLSDSSGTVQERYAYDAYGMPTFLTPAWGNRSDSSYKWETLFAGYRFDSTVGVCSVRNRILHPLLGSWSTRDPLGWLSGPSLLEYAKSNPIRNVDALALDIPPIAAGDIAESGQARLTFDRGWIEYKKQGCPPAIHARRNIRKFIWSQGCIGITQCFLGREFKHDIWFQRCYSTLAAALAIKGWTDCSKGGAKNLCGKPAQARVFGFTWEELPETAAKRTVCSGCGFVYWNGAPPTRVPIPGGDVFDAGFYDEEGKCFWHSDYAEDEEGKAEVLISTPEMFHKPGGKRSAVYCVICESDELNTVFSEPDK